MSDSVGPVRPGHELDVGALARWMADHVDGFRGPIAVEQFTGGQSNPTFRLSAPSGRYALRLTKSG